jgi:hypothetical protein
VLVESFLVVVVYTFFKLCLMKKSFEKRKN